ncbi:hypothetical protein RSAG8_13528, partial [Rhizoctonia solani AG-8 WAC10335]
MSLETGDLDGKSADEIEASLGRFHFYQFERLGEIDAILRAVEHQLWQFYIRRFDHLGELVDLEKAIGHQSRLLTFASDDHADFHGNLGASYFRRFERLGELPDLDKAIEHMSRAVALTPDSDSDLPGWLVNLGLYYSERFQRLGEVNDLKKAIECESRALELTPSDHPELPNRLGNLGESHRILFQCQGELDDLEKVIEYESRAIALTPNSHPNLPDQFGNLGLNYSERFERLRELDDLEKAIECESSALENTPGNHPDLPIRLGNLGASYGIRFQHQEEPNDLEKAIEHVARAVSLSPDGHPASRMWVVNLGEFYFARFQCQGELDDLEKAIQYQSRAIALTADDGTNLPKQLGNLGILHRDRFERQGEIDDLEKAIECESRALALTPNSHPSLSNRFGNLGLYYSERFKRFGELDDLEKAIEYESCALELTPVNHPDLPTRLGNLGASYGIRFQRLGEVDDLEKAIECESRALTLTPDEHLDFPEQLGNLGASYRDRFQHLGALVDLEKAIEHETRAVALTSDGHPTLPIWVDNLGVSYRDRFERLGKLGDLEKAIECGTRAVTLTPDEHPRLSDRLVKLGTCYRERFERQGELEDLETAIKHQSRALVLTPNGHPDLNLRHHNLATSHFARFELTSNSSDLENSLDCIRNASQSLTGAPRTMFWAALHWAKLVTKHGSLQVACIEAYQSAIDLLPRFIWLGSTTNQRYEDLLMVETLAVDAAVAAIRSSDYQLALEWLEHARCVVWNQNLMLRSPLHQLQSSHPVLANRLRTVTTELYVTSSESRTSRAVSSGLLTPEQIAQQHRRLAKEYNNLESQARILPGFEDFLQPMKANRLVRAAQNGPVVVINCHTDRCDALLISPERGNIEHIPLPNFNWEKAQQARSDMEASLRRKGIRERGVKIRQEEGHKDKIGIVLVTLWNDIVKPVLDFLGCMNDVLTDSLPHITWCPTGALSFLPLHAAGDYDQPKSRVFDYVVSSYTPTLTALLASVPSKLSRNCRVLGIGQAATPGRSALPGTTLELKQLEFHIQNKAEYSQLMGHEATTTAVLDAMAEHDWVHLACHAHQNVEDPTKSGFFLHNGTLDLASINRKSFKNKGLAFLSACQTATGDEKLPDEAIHLAAGMLMAGYSSVIATMWSVSDKDAPFVADKVYDQLVRDGKVGNGEAGKALHNAVAELRDKIGEKEFGRWVPYIHIGS